MLTLANLAGRDKRTTGIGQGGTLVPNNDLEVIGRNLRFLPVISTCETGKVHVEMLYTIYVLFFCMPGGLTLWRCPRRACIASKRFLVPEISAACHYPL